MKKATHSIWILMILLCLSISGCTSKEERWGQQLTASVAEAEYTVNQLKDHINNDLVKNALFPDL